MNINNVRQSIRLPMRKNVRRADTLKNINF